MYESLTHKQENFVQGLFAGLSQREAYIKAGYNTKNTSDNAIDVNACRLASNPKVALRLKELRSVVIDKVANKNIDISVEWIAQQYAQIAGVDLTKFVTWGQREVPVIGAFGPIMVGEGEAAVPLMKTVNYVDFIDSSLIDGTMVAEVKMGKDGASIKVHDRMKALDKLGQYLKMFDNKIDVNANISIEIIPAPKPEGID